MLRPRRGDSVARSLEPVKRPATPRSRTPPSGCRSNAIRKSCWANGPAAIFRPDPAIRPTPAPATPPDVRLPHGPAIPRASREAPARHRRSAPTPTDRRTDRVVLGAVTLPVGWRRSPRGLGLGSAWSAHPRDIDHSIDQRRRVLPRHRLAKPGLPRHRAQPLVSSPSPNTSNPDTGKPALRTAKSRWNAQPPTNGA